MTKAVITKADLVHIATEQHRLDYLNTGNSIHVWCAYVQARRVKAIPGWILTYFDEAAARLLAPGSTASAAATAAALGLRTKGGGASARQRAVNTKRAGAVRQRVNVWRARGLTRDEAIAKVAAVVGLSEDRVRNILYPKPRK